jgi:hypothetical protein
MPKSSEAMPRGKTGLLSLLMIVLLAWAASLTAQEITKDIPRAGAKWLGHRLSMLSDKQIRDCFRAAGYTPGAIGVFAQAVRKRIAELNAL